MINYKYRWCYAFLFNLIFVVIFYYYDIHPNLLLLRTLNEEEKIIQKKLTQQNFVEYIPSKKLKNRWIYQYKNQTEGLAEVVRICNENCLAIESIRYFPSRDTDRIYFKIVVKGLYKQFLAFLFALKQSENPLILMNFSTKIQEEDQYFWMDLLLLKYKNEQQNSEGESHGVQFELYNLQNPFCTKQQPFSPNQKNKITSTSVHVMKMVGFITWQNQPQALIKFPDDTLQSVSLGEKIGLENGVISAIDKDHLVIHLPKQQQKILKM